MTDQERFDGYVARNFRWNFGANMVEAVFFSLAMSFVSTTTIMPLLVSKLTPSKLAIGLIPAIFSLGFLLPQLLMANFTERLRYKKPFVALVSLLCERVPYLLIGLVLWRLAGSHPSLTLLFFYLLLATTAGAGGVLMPAWSDMIAKVIPVQRRGLWAGTANGLGALIGIFGAWLAGEILASRPFPNSFALCFLIAAAMLLLSWCGLAFNREPAGLTVKPHTPLLSYLRRLPALLHADRNFERFLISRSIAALGGMSGGFLMVYGAEQFGFGGWEVGILTAVMTGSQAVMNPVWGILGDRAGHKIVLVAAACCSLLASASALAAPTPLTFYVAFAFLGASVAADGVAGLNIAMEFGSAEDRPTYIGLTNTLLAPARTLAPILGGALAGVTGYRPMFTLAILLAGAGGLLLAAWVRDPRHVALGPTSAETA